MCGILAIQEAGVGADAVERMLDAMRHRGPDGRGARAWPDKGVALGHLRLSIIDLSDAAAQPMPDADGAVWISFNGEIYNYRAIREELERLGRRFRTGSDTEVVLQAFEEWGDDHCLRLRGMFAYAILDLRGPAPVLRVYRDQLGIKPVYVYEDGERFIVASELGAILAHPGVDRAHDPTALFDYLTYGCVPGEKTAFLKVRKLLPGSRLAREGGRTRVAAYWDLPAPTSRMGVEEAQALLARKLSDAVRDTLVSDVPVGVLLSGGLDSSTVATLAREHVKGPIPTFTIGFDEKSHDESDAARETATWIGADHAERILHRAELDALVEGVRTLYGEPFADGSAIPTRAVSRLARSRVKVALSGEGGDEMFAGYPRYFSWLRMRRTWGRLPAPLRKLVAAAARVALPTRERFEVLKRLDRGDLEQYAAYVELFTPAQKRALLKPGARAAFEGYDDYWHYRRYWRAGVDDLTRVQSLDLRTYLPDDLMTKIDRASMAEGLEVRPPLLHQDLVEFVFSLPGDVRVPGEEPKGLLKRAVGAKLPPGVLQRRKKGFSVPWHAWAPELPATPAADALPIDARPRAGMARKPGRAWALWMLRAWGG